MTDPEQTVAAVNGNMLKRYRRHSLKYHLKEQYYDFGSATSLHGLRYIMDRHLSVVEKVLWFIIFSVSFGFCVYRISDVWIKWREDPVLVTFNEHLVTPGSVSFPSVTICPQMKTKASEYNYTAMSKSLCSIIPTEHKQIPTSEMQIFEDLMLICDELISSIFYSYQNNITSRKNSTISTVKNLVKVAPSIKDVMNICKWGNLDIHCNTLFKTVLTVEGVCFNMNSIRAQEMFREENIWTGNKYLEKEPMKETRGWATDTYYDPNDDDPYPRRGQGNGLYPDLTIHLVEKNINHDEMCNSLNTGFKVYLQHPNDMPSSAMHHYIVTPGMRTSLALKFNLLTTAENLRYVSPETRQCFFPDERPLRYFKIYTASNCNIECLTNITYKLCKCVGFYMPRETDQKICTFLKLECMMKAREILVNPKVYNDLSKPEHKLEACNCLPSCNSMDYDADIIRSDHNFKKYMNAKNTFGLIGMDSLLKGNTFSMLSIYYKQPSYISIHRSELFGVTDFLANCGGLLGLFLGFSFLSVVEIIYFVTLKFWCAVKRDVKEENTA